MTVRPIEVPGWPRPRGYANGVVGTGAVLHVAGQIGWRPDGSFATDDMVEQFAQALDNVLAVVTAAGGTPRDVAEMTIYVTDLPAYAAATRAIGEAWRARLGAHYPAMALVAVSALVEPRARIEIQAVAYLEG